jgi:hypothetical protein
VGREICPSETKALPDGDLPYREWLERYAPLATRAPLADFHESAWEWFAGLTPGERPPAFLAPWARGLGKSTTVELGTTWTAVRGARRFALYVSATQQAANRHLADMAATMAAAGVERQVNKYGHSQGWNTTMLRTSNGFSALAVGLNSVQRGLKLSFVRPDLIILDDVDGETDTIDRILKKVRILRNTILPSGSPDCAVAFFQNVIHAQSIMLQLLEGQLDMLQDRVQTRIVPAIEGFEYAEYAGADGRTRYRIAGGESSWPGKLLDDWQKDLDAVGLEGFLREYQHRVGAGGLLFAAFEPTRQGQPWHVVEPFGPIPANWRVWGAHDYGETAPCCFLVFCEDEQGTVYLIAEFYKGGLSSPEQADAVLQMLERLGLAWPAIPEQRDGFWNTRLEYIAFDWASTFPPENDEERKGEYPVEVWWRRGLPCVRAVKDRKAGWRTVNAWLKSTIYDKEAPPTRGGYPMHPRFRLFRGAAPNVERTLAQAPAHSRDFDELDPGFRDDHPLDAVRYGMMVPKEPAPKLGSKAFPAAPGPRAIPTWLQRHLADEDEDE